VYNANLAINGTVTSQANYFGSVLAPYNSSGSQTYNGIISGNGGIVQRDSGTTILNGTNTYKGGTTPTTGVIAFGTNTTTNVVGAVVSGPIGTGPLYVVPETPNATGSGQVIAWGAARTIANPIQYPSSTNNQTLIIGGTNALNFTGPITLNGNDWPNTNTYTMRIFQVTNTALTTFSGVISDRTNGVTAIIGLVKSGNTNNSVLALNNTETYTGPTIVSNGTLQVNGSLNAASTVTVVSNATLAGTGIINGAVTINASGTLAPGASIGTITLNGGLTLNGNLLFEVNKSLSPQSNDVATVSGALTNGGTGTLTVANLGPALAVGDKFKLFNKPLTNGAALTVTGGGTGVTWANNLAVDGSIVVAPSAPPTIITQPTSRAVAQGSSATLSVTVSTVTGVTNYLWQMNSNTITASNISGATTNSALTITNFQAGNVGYYRVMINDGNNSTNSNNAQLTLAVSPIIVNSGVSGTTLTLQIPTEIGPTYLVQTNSNLATTNWQTAATISGDGTIKPFTTIITNSPQLFIRVKVQ
jgi:autotransporter-associated beta strand protein